MLCYLFQYLTRYVTPIHSRVLRNNKETFSIRSFRPVYECLWRFIFGGLTSGNNNNSIRDVRFALNLRPDLKSDVVMIFFITFKKLSIMRAFNPV